MKKFGNKDVYQLTCERFKFVFEEFDNIYVAFSGGKDSCLLYQLLLKYMSDNKISRKIGLFHQDYEAQYNATTEYVDAVMKNTPKYIERIWCCLPVRVRNVCSTSSPFWYPWDPEKKELWCRPIPDYPYVHSDISEFSTIWKKDITDYEFQHAFEKFYALKKGAKNSIVLTGCRAQESLTRYSAVANKKNPYKGQKWITKDYPGCYSAMPIYDWCTEDVWTGIGKFNFSYNRLYDLFYLSEVPIDSMRVASPFLDCGRLTLNLYRIIDSDSWAHLMSRVSGINFIAMYSNTKAMGVKNDAPPEGYTWESYAKFLLNTLPEDESERYIKTFCAKSETDSLDGAPDVIWKKRCMCILSNDVTCRNLKHAIKSDHSVLLKQKYNFLVRGGKTNVKSCV